MRLLARLYADGPTPSKVLHHATLQYLSIVTNDFVVVVEFHKAQIHGKVFIDLMTFAQPSLHIPCASFPNFKHNIRELAPDMSIDLTFDIGAFQ